MARPEYGVVYVAEEYPEWQRVTLVKLAELYNPEENSLPPNKDILAQLKGNSILKPHMKKLMHFVQYTKASHERERGGGGGGGGVGERIVISRI